MNDDDMPEVPITLEAVLGSSNIDAAGYDEESKIMIVQYQNGRQYQWRNIPPEVYQTFRNADSPGKYLHTIESRFGKGVEI